MESKSRWCHCIVLGFWTFVDEEMLKQQTVSGDQKHCRFCAHRRSTRRTCLHVSDGGHWGGVKNKELMRYTLRCWSFWTLWGCLGWQRRGSRGYDLNIEVSHCSASLESLCWMLERWRIVQTQTEVKWWGFCPGPGFGDAGSQSELGGLRESLYDDVKLNAAQHSWLLY